MKAVLWTHKFFDKNGNPFVGGVQTYLLELANLLREMNISPILINSHTEKTEKEISGIPAIGLQHHEWHKGVRGPTFKKMGLTEGNCIHIVGNVNIFPKYLGKRAIGIQHGIYWDRPVKSKGPLYKLAPTITNTLRSWHWASAVKTFQNLVCVDLIFPTMAACIFSPLPWKNIFYIPNFAPSPFLPPQPTGQIERIVFSRRFDIHRGTRIFSEAIIPILQRGLELQVHFIGEGPDEKYLRNKFNSFDNVYFYSLPFKRRMDAYDEKSLVVLPSLSTEGTSLTCIEAMSRGALVVATGVGGLSNLIIPNHNGLQVRPLADDLRVKIEEVLTSKLNIKKVQENGFNTFKNSFDISFWKSRWRTVIQNACNLQ